MAMCQKEYGPVMTEVEVETIDSTAPDGDSTTTSGDITPPNGKNHNK
jgi:hypothetical protein